MKRLVGHLGGVALLASIAFVGPLGAAPGNKYGDTTRTSLCQDADDNNPDGELSVSITGPEKLWPPNHKYVDVSLTATDTGGDDVTFSSEGTHEQYVDGEEMNGSGGGNGVNSGPDVDPAASGDVMGTGSATTQHDVRAERSGQDQTGRTYTLNYQAESTDGDTCVGSFTILVPHDMRGGADWK